MAEEKKVAICGTTPSRGYAPITDTSWQIWTIGPGGKDAHRWDRLFEIHNIWPENFAGYLNDLSQVKPPQIVHTIKPVSLLMERWKREHGDTEETRKVTGDWSAAVPLDTDRMFDIVRRHVWMSSSISYCMLQAILDGATDVGLYGIDLESGEEYISQWIGCAHIIDMMKDRGIRVHLPPGNGLDRDIKPYPDRYETDFARTMEKKAKFLAEGIGVTRGQWESTRVGVYRAEGALMALRKLGAPAEMIAAEEKQHMEMSIRADGFFAQMNSLQGEANATEFYRSRYVWGSRDPETPPK